MSPPPEAWLRGYWDGYHHRYQTEASNDYINGWHTGRNRAATEMMKVEQ